jgi:hypothetical protein
MPSVSGQALGRNQRRGNLTIFAVPSSGAVVYIAGKANRPRSPVLLNFSLTTVSMVLAIVAASLPGNSTEASITKIVLIYLGILIEVIGDVGSFFFLRAHISYAPERISERLACLSLIILGTSFALYYGIRRL